ncbi:phosphonate ABC transporter, permease protein PhnE [Kerstersia gyiorum]|uniref:phosphonate ABC transporter, permease protein PhnE n=1 Tax=Kerstersia gyiorum TaxID=206506 RepID=UPI00209DF3FB|nr:phosphonate ABC transporter, permease protein PhnE [Kerstersia gyiorum]MCP1634681.1 phosphonate transport system permease protein [Kerstersia gyiorum]MCP1635910.1 phosphonate transport system permease protein [Kerstersia gyiorum]MCP1672617.1 phosphonate transport system permease protein [Kerstersia gyiorum]MCP1680598.1 phosphonate transport system permease protein [Kerstersia gyiorum]MCP1683909.1 phosphonate transport system permease protein [Kerstersia gyiorum]
MSATESSGVPVQTLAAPSYPTRWRRPPRWGKPWKTRLIALLCLAYLFWALGSLPINWDRAAEGFGRAALLFRQFLVPDFSSRWTEIAAGLVESLAMTITATVLGIALSVPVALGAARNMAPWPVYAACRTLVAGARAFPEIIIAILFVKMFGFGPLAGMVTLVIASIGFLAKLLADEIETIDPSQWEALRATGASWLQCVAFAVMPQIKPRLAGLSMYRLDINFRESAVLGIVGAGGIGATLNTALDRYEFDAAGAILLLIIVIVLLAEYASGLVRRHFQ